jgi:hypothetical protein
MVFFFPLPWSLTLSATTKWERTQGDIHVALWGEGRAPCACGGGVTQISSEMMKCENNWKKSNAAR